MPGQECPIGYCAHSLSGRQRMRGVNEGSGVKGTVPVCIAEPGGERPHLPGDSEHE